MAQTTERLQCSRDDELKEWRSEDVERRLDELSALESALRTEQVTAEFNVFAALGNEVNTHSFEFLWRHRKSSVSVSYTQLST